MKTVRKRFDAILRWLRWPIRSEEMPTCEITLVEEIEALLELMLYAATQTVAHVKLLEREVDRPQQNQELMSVQRDVEHLRQSIRRIQELLKTARNRTAVSDSRTAYEEASQLAGDVGNPRDLAELEDAVFSKND